MTSFPQQNAFVAACAMPQLPLPTHIWRLTQAVSMKRFDQIIAYGYALGIAAALAQQYCRVRITDSFETEVSLFFLTIAPSGSGKGSTWKSLYEPMKELIAQRRSRISAENKERRAKIVSLEAAKAEKRKKAGRLSGYALDAIMREIAELEARKPELLPDYVFDVQDVTTASLLEELARQESHSILIADTEGRVTRSIDEDKALSGMLNQAFSGEPVNNTRKSVKSYRVENPRVSLVAAVQPDKLKRLTRNHNLWGEGMMPRTLPYYSSCGVLQHPAIGEIEDREIMEWWRKKLKYLFDLKPQIDYGGFRPCLLALDHDAYMRFQEYVQSLEGQKVLPWNAGLESTFSRLPEIAVRLSAIYHILEYDSPFNTLISGDDMGLAIDATSFFFENHIRRLYAEFHPAISPLMKALAKLCIWLRSREGTQEYVTIKEMYGGVGGDKTWLYEAIKSLVQQGVLTPATQFELNMGMWSKAKSCGFTINFLLLPQYFFGNCTS